MPALTIPTYDVPVFRERFMANEQPPGATLRLGYEQFFAVRVEEMFRQIRLPVPPMRAQTTSVILLTSGEANMQIGGEAFQIFENECLVVPVGQVFSFDKPDVNTGYLLHFSHDFLTGKFATPDHLQSFEFLQVWGNPVVKMPIGQADFVHHLAGRLLHDYQQHGLKNAEMQQAYLFALFCELKLTYQPRLSVPQGPFLNITNRFLEFLQLHFKQLHRVSDYAQLLHISPNHLNKAVKSSTGKSPTRWIDDCLLLESKVLLAQTRLSVSEIAVYIGMADASYFSRFFKKREGITPLDFRRMIEKS